VIDREAWMVLALLRAGSVPQQIADESIKDVWHPHVRALPYDRTMAAARRWIVAPNPDGKPKYLSTLDDVLTALEVPADARHLVAEAAWSNGEVYPAVEGWICVPHGAVPPAGVARLAALRAETERDAKRLSLPAERVIDAEKKAGMLARLAGAARRLRSESGEMGGWE
jgi:hypothetical protein